MPRQSPLPRPPKRPSDHGGSSTQYHGSLRRQPRRPPSDHHDAPILGGSSTSDSGNKRPRRTIPALPATPPLTPEAPDLTFPRASSLPGPVVPRGRTRLPPRDSVDDEDVDMSTRAAEQSHSLYRSTPLIAASHEPHQMRPSDGEMNLQRSGPPVIVVDENELPVFEPGNHVAQVLRPPGLERTDLPAFLRWWDSFGVNTRSSSRLALDRPPNLVSEVRYEDLHGDLCDFQGIDWEALGTTRRRARAVRPIYYKAQSNPQYSHELMPGDAACLARRESFFRFKRMDIRRDALIAHYQLRSLLACPTRSQAFYVSNTGVQCFNPISRTAELAIPTPQPSDTSPVTAIDAGHGLVAAGTLHGSYYIQPYAAESRHISVGKITHNRNPFINHVNVHMSRRSSAPLASFASNDCKFKIMDLARQEFVLDNTSQTPINRTAVSPDGQLRVVVGDSKEAHIVSTEGECHVRHLSGHNDYLFGCAWCDDGWTMATSSQDSTIKIWDARHWCNSDGVSTPLSTITCDMDVAPNLCFSPVGSGRRVLVAAESADFVHLVDAQTFASKQTLDMFGEIAGVSFTNDGQDLSVLCADPYRGGLLQLERCGRGPDPQVDDSMVPRELAHRLEADGRPWLSARTNPTKHRRQTVFEAADPF